MPSLDEPKLISGNGNMSLAKGIARRMTLYRGDAVHLVDALGREKFILPRFDPREGEDPEAIKQLHKLAEKGYRAARPGALIEWVDTDVAADLLGGLHCMMIALPVSE